jgi:hypothetical protein
LQFRPAEPFRNSSTTFTNYQIGIGGACANYDPPAGFWCGNDTTRGGNYMTAQPSGASL